jgi:hypothetical protein
VARAVAQLQAAGISTSPGEHVRFLFTRGEPGVHAWNLPEAPDPACLDVARYSELLVRAAGTMLGPFGVSEDLLRQWLFSNAAYAAPPGRLPPLKRADLPLLASRAGAPPEREDLDQEPVPAWGMPVLVEQPILAIYDG